METMGNSFIINTLNKGLILNDLRCHLKVKNADDIIKLVSKIKGCDKFIVEMLGVSKSLVSKWKSENYPHLPTVKQLMPLIQFIEKEELPLKPEFEDVKGLPLELTEKESRELLNYLREDMSKDSPELAHIWYGS